MTGAQWAFLDAEPALTYPAFHLAEGLDHCAASGMCPRLVRVGVRYCCGPCGDGWEADPRYEAVHTESCDARDAERRPEATR